MNKGCPELTHDQLRSALAASEERFHNVVNNSPDGIVVTSLDGFILYVNSEASQMFGHPSEKLVGKPFGYPMISGEATEIEVLQPGSLPMIAEMRTAEILWEGDAALMSSMRDLSERARLINELQRSNTDLEEFATVLSHDIRAPLRNMGVLASWLKEDHAAELHPDAMEDLQMLASTSRRVQRMLEDLLNYSRVGLHQSFSSGIDLEQLFDEVIDELSLEISSKNAQIVRSSLPTIDCNIKQIRSLFFHLVSNALNFCASDPVVTVTSEQDRHHCIIKFTDNGTGIKKEHWRNLFVPFTDLHTEKNDEGSGIGLATCHKIASRHEGELWLDSTLGKGSTFYVKLPNSHTNLDN